MTCPECAHRVTVPSPEALETSAAPAADAAEQMDRGQAQLEFVQPEHAQLEIVQPEQAQRTPEEVRDEWTQHDNPWIEEDTEEEDFSLGERGLDESGLDMTPMVDVTFLLLIFFMITASFSMQKSMETAPPEPDEEGAAQSVTMEDLEEESVVVEIDEENNLRVDDVPVSGTGELKDVLAAKIGNEGKTEMLIEAHPNARHGLVVAVTDAGIDVQMQRIRRSVKKSVD